MHETQLISVWMQLGAVNALRSWCNTPLSPFFEMELVTHTWPLREGDDS